MADISAEAELEESLSTPVDSCRVPRPRLALHSQAPALCRPSPGSPLRCGHLRPHSCPDSLSFSPEQSVTTFSEENYRLPKARRPHGGDWAPAAPCPWRWLQGPGRDLCWDQGGTLCCVCLGGGCNAPTAAMELSCHPHLWAAIGLGKGSAERGALTF